jgi:hypothetical protein
MIVCISYVPLIDASVAEEEPEEGYYQEEEGYYPGHFSNQGKPYLLIPLPSFIILVFPLFKKSAY